MRQEQGIFPILKENENGFLDYEHGVIQKFAVGNSRVYQADCMDLLRQTPDKYYHLSIVDPPYRETNQPTKTMRSFNTEMRQWPKPPDAVYFAELFRVSKNQIVHGGNYFTAFLPANNNWIVWYKNNDGLGFSMAELFWSSVEKNVRVFDFRPMGQNGDKIHPTQKPVALYRWLLKNYAKPGDKILDTHLGSGSSRIAAHEAGHDFVGFELDKDYFDAMENRFQKYLSQGNLFEV